MDALAVLPPAHSPAAAVAHRAAVKRRIAPVAIKAVSGLLTSSRSSALPPCFFLFLSVQNVLSPENVDENRTMLKYFEVSL